jgi:hypothetical protein
MSPCWRGKEYRPDDRIAAALPPDDETFARQYWVGLRLRTLDYCRTEKVSLQ